MYLYIGGWWVSPTGKSFRFVSCVLACVRAVLLVRSVSVQKVIPRTFPFPFWYHALFRLLLLINLFVSSLVSHSVSYLVR